MAKNRQTPATERLTRQIQDFTGQLCQRFRQEISRNPRDFKKQVLRVIRRELPPGRGRPASPRIEAAIEMLQKGKTVREVLQEQVEGFEQVDAYGRYLMEKALRQAIARRRRHKTKQHSQNHL
jgi:hypothetical protein